MFSQLGPLFKTTFRQAEANDTRQNIPHDEIDKGKRKREEEDAKENEQPKWEDQTTVSVTSLRAFLVNFLGTMPEATDGTLTELTSRQNLEYQRPHETTRPTNTKNAKAVRAYQSMAAQSKVHTGSKPPPKAPKAIANKDAIQSKELRDIYQLIDDLDALATRGIEELTILKADTFVEALKHAVQHIKSSA